MERTAARWSIVIPLALAAGAVAWLVWTKEPAEIAPRTERARSMRVISITPTELVPRATGYGTASPGRTWRAVARVEGRVTGLFERLRSGAQVAEDQILVELDPTPFELAIAHSNADIARAEAELAELNSQETGDKARLAIEEESLELAETELARQVGLRADGTVSDSAVDAARRNSLTQEQVVQNLESGLALVPAKRAAKEAELAAHRASLSESQLDLGYATLRAPFDGVVAAVDLSVGQYLARGETLFELYSRDRAEIDAEFLFGDARRVLGPEARAMIGAAAAAGVPLDEAGMGELFEATVSLDSGDLEVSWEGRIVGSREDVNSTTRGMSLTIAVDNPYDQVIPGVRPPLLKGTFCAVELRGEPLQDCIVIPRSSLQGDAVYVLSAEDRLNRREVQVRFEQGNLAVIEAGLSEGERVIVGDPGVAIDGMLVDPIDDEVLSSSLLDEARGVGSLK